MLYYEAHLEQAEQNIRLLQQIIQDHPNDWLDWQVTIAYYAAVHLARTHIALCIGELGYDNQIKIHEPKDREITIHKSLIRVVSKPISARSKLLNGIIAYPKAAAKAFTELHTLSEKARYLTGIEPNNFSVITGNWIEPQDRQDARDYLADIILFLGGQQYQDPINPGSDFQPLTPLNIP